MNFRKIIFLSVFFSFTIQSAEKQSLKTIRLEKTIVFDAASFVPEKIDRMRPHSDRAFEKMKMESENERTILKHACEAKGGTPLNQPMALPDCKATENEKGGVNVTCSDIQVRVDCSGSDRLVKSVVFNSASFVPEKIDYMSIHSNRAFEKMKMESENERTILQQICESKGGTSLSQPIALPECKATENEKGGVSVRCHDIQVRVDCSGMSDTNAVNDSSRSQTNEKQQADKLPQSQIENRKNMSK